MLSLLSVLAMSSIILRYEILTYTTMGDCDCCFGVYWIKAGSSRSSIRDGYVAPRWNPTQYGK